MIWVISVLLFMIVIMIICAWYRSKTIENEDIPTMYLKCDRNTRCGGNLVCDNGRCRQPVNGKCSSTTDCESGLICSNWTCVKEVKSVHWKDKDEIHYI